MNWCQQELNWNARNSNALVILTFDQGRLRKEASWIINNGTPKESIRKQSSTVAVNGWLRNIISYVRVVIVY